MRHKEHCDNYLAEDYREAKRGDCIKPVNGRWKPRRCEGVCPQYSDTAYKLKKALARYSLA